MLCFFFGHTLFPDSCLKIFLSGARFAKNFVSELLVFGLCAQLVFFGVILPMVLLYCVGFFSRQLPEFFFPRRAFYEQLSGVNFRFKAPLSVRCVLVMFCPGFGIIIWVFSPERCLNFFCFPRRASVRGMSFA